MGDFAQVCQTCCFNVTEDRFPVCGAAQKFGRHANQ